MKDTSICVICGGGTANQCGCSCPGGPTFAELPGSSLNPQCAFQRSSICPQCGKEQVMVHSQETTAVAKQIGGSHYQTPIQPWDFIVANDLGFLEGNAIKYIARHRKKNGREDLEKAVHYLQKALEVYYPKT